MISENKLSEMKAFAEHQDNDVVGVTIPCKDMIDIADTALKLLEENKRLREALEKIALGGTATIDLENIARSALRGGGE